MVRINKSNFNSVKVGMIAKLMSNATIHKGWYSGIITAKTNNGITFWGLPDRLDGEDVFLGCGRKVPVRYYYTFDMLNNEDIKIMCDIDKENNSCIEWTYNFLIEKIDERIKLSAANNFWIPFDSTKNKSIEIISGNKRYVDEVFTALETAMGYKGNIFKDYSKYYDKLMEYITIEYDKETEKRAG